MISFQPTDALAILRQTPGTLIHLLENLPENWTMVNEGDETWSAYDVMGHLIHGEQTDWLERMEIILRENGDKKFKHFDRFAQFRESKGKTMRDLLREFKQLREHNLEKVQAFDLSEEQFSKVGIHPVFGEVTLKQLMSTWAVHDLNHIAQITRVLASQYREEVGPWVEYLRILK